MWGVNGLQQIKKPCTGQWVIVDGLMYQIDGGQNEVCGINEGSGFIFCRPVDGSGVYMATDTKVKNLRIEDKLPVPER